MLHVREVMRAARACLDSCLLREQPLLQIVSGETLTRTLIENQGNLLDFQFLLQSLFVDAGFVLRWPVR